MPFIEPVIPYDGEYLSALFHLNPLIDNCNWLAAQAARRWSVFTGAVWSFNEQFEHTEHPHWTGYFRYDGRNNLLGSLTNSGGRMRLYCAHNTGVATLYSGYGTPTFPLDISGGGLYAHVVGSYYAVQVSGDPEWVSGSSLDAGRVNYLAIERDNSQVSWPTLPTFTDGNVVTRAQLNLLVDAQHFLRELLPPTGSSLKVTGTENPGPTVQPLYSGMFYARKVGTTMQRSVRVVYRFQNAPATLYFYDSADVLQDTFSLTCDATQHDQVYTLTGTYTANTFCRIYADCLLDQNEPDIANSIQIAHISVGGSLPLQHVVPQFAKGDRCYGSTTAARLAYLKENLDDIRSMLRGTGTVYGFQFLAPQPSQALALYANGANEVSLDYTSPYLTYFPTGVGVSGTLYYGTKNVSLPDVNGNGSVTSLDLRSVDGLAPGMRLRVSGVSWAMQQDSL